MKIFLEMTIWVGKRLRLGWMVEEGVGGGGEDDLMGWVGEGGEDDLMGWRRRLDTGELVMKMF